MSKRREKKINAQLSARSKKRQVRLKSLLGPIVTNGSNSIWKKCSYDIDAVLSWKKAQHQVPSKPREETREASVRPRMIFC